MAAGSNPAGLAPGTTAVAAWFITRQPVPAAISAATSMAAYPNPLQDCFVLEFAETDLRFIWREPRVDRYGVFTSIFETTLTAASQSAARRRARTICS